MKIFRYTVVFIIAMNMSFCNQSFSDKEKELLGETGKETLEDMSKEPSKEKELKNSFSKPLCDLLTQSNIKSVFPDAADFEFKRMKEKTPNCQIGFSSLNAMLNMKIGVGIIVEGRKIFQRQSDQEYIETLKMYHKDWVVIESLGDEAYFFPSDTSPAVVVMYKDQRFRLQLGDMSENNKEKTLKLAQSFVSNMQ